MLELQDFYTFMERAASVGDYNTAAFSNQLLS